MGRADRVIAFVENLTVSTGPDANKPLVLRHWQKDIIRGVYDPVLPDGRRQVREALLTMARKNGKTELIAALALCHLMGPESETRGEVYSAAVDRFQAAQVFKAAKAMIEADAELRGMVNIIESTKRIVHYGSGSFYQALSSDAKSKHGFNPSCVIYDELAQARDRNLYDVLTTAMGARGQPLTWVISTKSANRHSVMSELVEYGRQVRGGIVPDPAFRAFIFEVPLDADPFDESLWKLANPALGDFRSLEEMRQAAAKAQRIPARLPAFRNLYLNQEVDPTAEPMFSAAQWDACADPVDPEELRGRPCYAGLDLGSTKDLSALVLYFPEDGGAVLPFFWLPGDDLDERGRADGVPYTTWREQGLIEAHPGRAVDKRAVAYRLAELASAFDIVGLAYDRWRMADLQKILDDEGIILPMKDFGQGYKDMGPAVEALETRLLEGKLRHGGHPVLRWNIANAKAETDPTGFRKITKPKSLGRVDGAVALTMAVGLWSKEPPPVELDFSDMVLLV